MTRILLLFLGLTLSSASAKNVLLLISDNQNWFDVGCYGNQVIRTPHIDGLANDGVRFRHGFATTASCGPSRAVIYTGLLTHRNGQYAHPHGEHNQQIRENVTTVFARLKDAGFRTALLGKDHIKPKEKYPIDFKPRVRPNEVVQLAEAAGEFMSADDPAPFFLAIGYTDPHPTSLDGVGWGIKRDIPGYEPVIYDPSKLTVPGFLPDTPAVRESIAGYYQQISRLDHGIGLALKALEETGKADDTLVIFISDHGTSEPGAMATHYDPGIRVPFIVRKPGGPKGIVNEAMVAFTDITPTVLDWAGIDAPAEEFHGRSILPILDKPSATGWDDVLLSQVGHDVFANYPMRTLRERRYKLIWNVTYQAEYPVPIDTYQRHLWESIRQKGLKMVGPRTVDAFLHRPQIELYDLETDPWEVTNLASNPDHTERREAMIDRLLEKLEPTEDPWLRKYHPRLEGAASARP